MILQRKASAMYDQQRERGFGLAKFSVAERERRWRRVRERMRQEGSTAIIGFPIKATGISFRPTFAISLTSAATRPKSLWFSRRAESRTAFVRGGNEIEWWNIAQDWVTDIRPSRRPGVRR
jgi:hypothetical protein